MKRRGHTLILAGILLLILMLFPQELNTLAGVIGQGDAPLLVLAGLVAIVVFHRA